MSKLRDHFPRRMSREYAGRCLTSGQVLYLYSDFTNPPKEKYLILAHQGMRPLLFVINSRIGPYIASRPDLLECQIQLNASDYGFLDHDSFASCGEVIDCFTESEIKNQIVADFCRIKGELTSTTKQEIICVVQNARTINTRHKRLIVASLSP